MHVQHLIDGTKAAFKAGKIANNPFTTSGREVGVPTPLQLIPMEQRWEAPGASEMMAPAMRSGKTTPPMMMKLQSPVQPMMCETFYVRDDTSRTNRVNRYKTVRRKSSAINK